MRTYIYLMVMLTPFLINAQTAFYNFGNIQMHSNAKIGFHTDLINDGTFDDNKGLAGFYNKSDYLIVSGTNKAVFNNVEVDVDDNLYLETSLGITNNLSFILGNIITPRNVPTINLEFINYEVYAGEGDYNHIDGYAKTINVGEFIFPIGHEDNLRPMILPNQLTNTFFTGAYFRENPNSPSTFTQLFNTSEKQFVLNKISEVEFWDLDGLTETTIVLTWNFDSNIEALTDDIQNLRVVGWSKTLNKWVDLGEENISGNLEEGKIESNKFIPNNYEIITIGSSIFKAEHGNVTNHNFMMSPNGDGINDTFIIEDIGLRPNNMMYIYNRWGALVYSKKNYDNSWGGISDHNLTINRSKGLPEGTYFYILKFENENRSWQGWIYLRR